MGENEMTANRKDTCSIVMPTTHTIQFSAEVVKLEESRNRAATDIEHACEPAIHFTVNVIELMIRKKKRDRPRGR